MLRLSLRLPWLYAVECVATSEIDLSGIWQGTNPDVIRQAYTLLPAVERVHKYPSGHVGSVCLTLVAAKALASLRAIVDSTA